MQAGLAFAVGILVVIAVFLFLAAFLGATYFGLAVQGEVILAVTIVVVALIIALIFYAGVKAQFKKVKTGKEALIGSTGIATSDLKPTGEVRVMGEFWQATVKDAAIPAGQAIVVVGMDGLFLVVQPIEQKA